MDGAGAGTDICVRRVLIPVAVFTSIWSLLSVISTVFIVSFSMRIIYSNRIIIHTTMSTANIVQILHCVTWAPCALRANLSQHIVTVKNIFPCPDPPGAPWAVGKDF